MECENQVADALISYGYPIFYRNLKIRYHRSEIAELDIVSSKFIVEVKSARFGNCKNNGFNFFYRHNLLPDKYLYFIYSSATSDEEIEELQAMYSSSPSYKFINRLDRILEFIPPMRNAVVTTEKVFRKLTQHYAQQIKSLNTLIVPRSIFDTVYSQLLQHLDKPTAYEQKCILDAFVQAGLLRFDESLPEHTYPILTTKKGIAVVKHIRNLEPLKLYPTYYAYNLPTVSKE